MILYSSHGKMNDIFSMIRFSICQWLDLLAWPVSLERDQILISSAVDGEQNLFASIKWAFTYNSASYKSHPSLHILYTTFVSFEKIAIKTRKWFFDVI